MHSYAIGGKKSNIRSTIATILFVVSIIVTTLINNGIGWLSVQFPSVFDGVNKYLNTWSFLNFSFGNISALLVFGVFVKIFDKKVWDIKNVNRFLGIPDFSGTWEGELISSYSGDDKYAIRMIIEQSWSEISIKSIFTNSDSGSDSAIICPEHHLGIMLKFTYSNIAKDPGFSQSEHRGQNELFLEDYDASEKKYMTLRGTYFNNRGKTGNKGTIVMRRTK